LVATIPEKLTVEIVTPERRVISRECDEVILPGAEGSFGVLPGHAPMLSALTAGVAIARFGNDRGIMAIGGGFAEVLPDRVIVLAETCERSDEIDVDRARKMVSQLEERLRHVTPETDVEVVRSRMLKHAARLDAVAWR
jgi:F-type H+-transporting ATPase subunit epsilon